MTNDDDLDRTITNIQYDVWRESPRCSWHKGPSVVQTELFRYAALQISTHLTVFAAVLLFDDATSGT